MPYQKTHTVLKVTDNIGITVIPKNCSSLFRKILWYDKKVNKDYFTLHEFLSDTNIEVDPLIYNAYYDEFIQPIKIDKNKYKIITYLRNPSERLVSAILEEIYIGAIGKNSSLHPPLTLELLKRKEVVNLQNWDHTRLQIEFIETDLEYTDYEYYYGNSSIPKMLVKNNICRETDVVGVRLSSKNILKNKIKDDVIDIVNNTSYIQDYLQEDFSFINSLVKKGVI